MNKNLQDFLISAVNQIPRVTNNIFGMDRLTYIKEFNTIDLSLPRAIGKTKALLNLHSNLTGALFIGRTHSEFSHINNFATPDSLERVLRVSSRGMFDVPRYLLLDEVPVNSVLAVLAHTMVFFATDLVIVRVGTDR